jgi:hypothetical protein
MISNSCSSLPLSRELQDTGAKDECKYSKIAGKRDFMQMFIMMVLIKFRK